jgi:hypothetical protein
MGFFKSKPQKQIQLMVEKIDSLSDLPESEICTWKNGVPIYNEKIEAFFRFDDFWIVRDYNQRMKDLMNIKMEEWDLEGIKTRLTAINRSERFNYGAWGRTIQDGTLTAISNRLKQIKD